MAISILTFHSVHGGPSSTPIRAKGRDLSHRHREHCIVVPLLLVVFVFVSLGCFFWLKQKTENNPKLPREAHGHHLLAYHWQKTHRGSLFVVEEMRANGLMALACAVRCCPH